MCACRWNEDQSKMVRTKMLTLHWVLLAPVGVPVEPEQLHQQAASSRAGAQELPQHGAYP